MAAYKGGQEYAGPYTNSKNVCKDDPMYPESLVNGLTGDTRASSSLAERTERDSSKTKNREVADVTGGAGLSDVLPKR
jgi:hypothetical protein